jgi:hypothetical protein
VKTEKSFLTLGPVVSTLSCVLAKLFALLQILKKNLKKRIRNAKFPLLAIGTTNTFLRSNKSLHRALKGNCQRAAVKGQTKSEIPFRINGNKRFFNSEKNCLFIFTLKRSFGLADPSLAGFGLTSLDLACIDLAIMDLPA